MPETQDQHFNLTVHEWKTWDYFTSVVRHLVEHQITQYVDIGANVGGVAHVLLESVPSLQRCYLFEPQAANYAFMKNKFGDNPKVDCLNCGIFYGQTQSQLYRTDRNVGGYTVVPEAGFTDQGETCNLTTLESYEFSRIDFIKIDVEGAEYNIIENSSLLKTVKFLDIEFHKPTTTEYIHTHFPNHKIAVSMPNNGHVFLVKH